MVPVVSPKYDIFGREEGSEMCKWMIVGEYIVIDGY
jgi:hypothetical protein